MCISVLKVDSHNRHAAVATGDNAFCDAKLKCRKALKDKREARRWITKGGVNNMDAEAAVFLRHPSAASDWLSFCSIMILNVAPAGMP